MSDDEDNDSQPGYRVGGDVGSGRGGGDDEPTLVIVPRIPRPTISKGLRILGTAFKEFRRTVFELADRVDEATALGAVELSEGEAHEADDTLSDAIRRIRGIRSSLRRARTPAPLPPTTNGTNGETP